MFAAGFEVYNSKNVPFIKYEGVLINLNNVNRLSLQGSSIFVAGVTDADQRLNFADAQEARLAFEKITGGNKGVPTSKELKENKTRHYAIQEAQAEWL